MNALPIVYRKELRESFRDRRSVLNALLIAPLLGPFLFVLLLKTIVGRELEKAEKPLPVVVVGGEYAPNLIGALVQMGLEVKPPMADPERAIREQRIDLALTIPASFPTAWREGRPAEVQVIYDSSQREGGSSVSRLKDMLNRYSRETGAMRLAVRGVSPTTIAPLIVADRDQATPSARGALLFAMLPYFLVLTAFIGGMFLAIDSTAGERERQSLEPLFVNPVPRQEILFGKLLATATFSLMSVLLSLGAFMVAGRVMPTAELGMSLDLGLGFALSVLPLLVPVVGLVACLQTLVAAFARSFREAQTYLGLLQLVPVVPSLLLSALPIKPVLWMYGVPLVGQQLCITRLLRGEAVTPLQSGLATGVTLVALVVALAVTRRVFQSERLAIST